MSKNFTGYFNGPDQHLYNSGELNRSMTLSPLVVLRGIEPQPPVGGRPLLGQNDIFLTSVEDIGVEPMTS